MTLSITNTSLIIPTPILSEVFKYLDVADLKNCCLVNKEWNKLANSNTVWWHFIQREFEKISWRGAEKGPEARDINFRETLTKFYGKKLSSNKQIVIEIDRFLKKYSSLNENAEFRCIIPHEEKARAIRYLTIEIKGNPQSHDKIREDWISINDLGTHDVPYYFSADPRGFDFVIEPEQGQPSLYFCTKHYAGEKEINIRIPSNNFEIGHLDLKINQMVRQKCKRYCQKQFLKKALFSGAVAACGLYALVKLASKVI